MINIIVFDRAGQETEVQAETGSTLMEVIRDNGFDELIALCGGSCSCATCHVHIHADFIDRLTEMSPDESELLDSSEHRDQYSRLACQISILPDLDGMKVRIAEAD